MGREPKPVNERFFDEESKEMWYVLGLSYSRYFPSRQDTLNTWSSSSLDLIEIIKRELESGHAIIHEERTQTHKLRFYSDHLQSMLFQRGCIPGKENRRFPKYVKQQYLDHFIRGFFDAHVTVHSNGTSQIYYDNIAFLQGLHEALVRVNAVQNGRNIERSPLYYGRLDVQGINDFLYRDWDYIKEHGLYVPSKKERFRI